MIAKFKPNNDQRWFTDRQNYIITNDSVLNNHVFISCWTVWRQWCK